MRIPPYKQLPGWLRFFAGVIVGILIGWGFFIHQYGDAYEQLLIKLTKQAGLIETQESRIEELLREQKVQNEENQKKLTLQEITISFTNERDLRLNKLTLYELEQQALSELSFLERKDIESIAKTKDLLIRTVENKRFQIGDNYYRLNIEEVYLFTTLQLYIEIIPEKN